MNFDILLRDGDMPLFPVDQPRFRTLTDRVECAQRLDKLSLQVENRLDNFQKFDFL